MTGKWNLYVLMLLGSLGLPTFANAQTNQTLDGQIVGLSKDISVLMQTDRLLRGRKLRIDRVSSSGIPDANYDQFLEQAVTHNLKEFLDQSSRLLLKVEYSYLVSETNTNQGNRVIQIEATIMERGRTLKKFLREVNNTSDIGRMTGSTQDPPDTQDYQIRLTAVETAVEEPSFYVLNDTQVASSEGAKYRVEIRKRIGGQGPAIPVKPVDESGRAFAPVDIADTYEIALFNYDREADAVAKVDIDGLSVIGTFCEDTDASGKVVAPPGYFIARATSNGPGMHVIPGWFHTIKPGDDNVFEFVVNELGKGAASVLKVRGKTGVITVRFFDACHPDEQPRRRSFGETGKGQPRKQDYELVPAVIGTEPSSIVTIRYSRAPKGKG